MTETVFGPISAEWIAAYALASGDDNPLHRSDFPQRPAIVHGALIAALAERYLGQVMPHIALRSMRFKFLSPVKAGSYLAFRLGESRTIEVDGKPMIERRITVQSAGIRPCAIGDCVYAERPR